MAPGRPAWRRRSPAPSPAACRRPHRPLDRRCSSGATVTGTASGALAAWALASARSVPAAAAGRSGSKPSTIPAIARRSLMRKIFQPRWRRTPKPGAGRPQDDGPGRAELATAVQEIDRVNHDQPTDRRGEGVGPRRGHDPGLDHRRNRRRAHRVIAWRHDATASPARSPGDRRRRRRRTAPDRGRRGRRRSAPRASPPAPPASDAASIGLPDRRRSRVQRDREQRLRQPFLAAEVVVERRLRDAGRLNDLAHRRGVVAPRREEPRGHPRDVPRRCPGLALPRDVVAILSLRWDRRRRPSIPNGRYYGRGRAFKGPKSRSGRWERLSAGPLAVWGSTMTWV